MARKSKSYWEKRSTELMLRLEKGTENTIESLIQVYEQATKNINKEIKDIFKNYAKDSGLKKEILLQLLSKKETDTHYKNLLEVINNYITDKDIKKKLLAQYNAPAYSYRISRYQALQDNINVELKRLADLEQNITQIRYVDTIKEGYYHNIYDVQKGLNLGFSFTQMNTKTIKMLLAENWIDKSNFSKRIWKNNEKLGNYLKTNLTADTMSGKSIQKISSELSNYMDVGLYNATTLVRTEVNHFANEAEMLSYEECGIEKYRFIATLDNVTCEHCGELDNKVFYLKDRVAGKNYPPIHPNDRCTTVAEFDNNVIEGLTRRAKDENGNTILVPQNMNYKEWYNRYVDLDENIFNKNKNSKKIDFKDVTYLKETFINRAYNNPNIRKIVLNTEIESIKVGGNRSYHKKGNLVFKESYNDHTIRHEMAHAVDYANSWLSSDKNFIIAIQKDKKHILNNTQIYKNLIKNNRQYIELSDIIGGITNNKVVGNYYHKKKYWKNGDKLQKEIFAQIFSAAGNDNLEQLEIFQTYLPNTFKEFDNLIRRLL